MKCIYTALIASVMLFSACGSDEKLNEDVDFQKYENLLKQDYNAAASHHNSLKSGEQYDYNYKMYNRCDSLFSSHFYEFCVNYMQNGQNMNRGKQGQMHGNRHHGGMWGNAADFNKMKQYMDSLRQTGRLSQYSDFRCIDSLMIRGAGQCRVMNGQTNRIQNCLDQMQTLRRQHYKLYRK